MWPESSSAIARVKQAASERAMARSDPGDGRFCGCDGVDVSLQWRAAEIAGRKIMPLAPLAADITGKAASQAWSVSYKNLAPQLPRAESAESKDCKHDEPGLAKTAVAAAFPMG